MTDAPRPAVPPAAPPPTAPSTFLPPAARLLWRSQDQAQIEVGSRRAVVDGLDTEAARHLVGRAAAAAEAPPSDSVMALQDELVDRGLLWPSAGVATDPRQAPPVARLAAELGALTARVGEAGAELLAARRYSTVVVQGEGRAGPHIAAVLAAAGVGRVHVAATAPVRLHHATPGGVTPADEGVPIASAAAGEIRRHAPEADPLPPAFGDRTDLVVLADDAPIDPERRDALHARECAHLAVRLASDHGVVGPLVLPGLTSCLRCADLHRLDRDPAWRALAVQLSVPHRADAVTPVALATVIAGLAALQALAFLDGGRPAAVEGSLEMHLPDWRLRRRSWPAHPDCDCMPAAHPRRSP